MTQCDATSDRTLLIELLLSTRVCPKKVHFACIFIFWSVFVQSLRLKWYNIAMANYKQRLQAAQAFVVQNPGCCLLDLNVYELELDDLADLRGDCEPIDCGDGCCPYAGEAS